MSNDQKQLRIREGKPESGGPGGGQSREWTAIGTALSENSTSRDVRARGLSQISGVHGTSGMAANFALLLSEAAHDPESDCREAKASVQRRLHGPALRDICIRWTQQL